MKARVFWPAATFAVVLGLALLAFGLLAATDPEGRGVAAFFAGGSSGLLLLPDAMVEEVDAEAERLDRPMSWVVQRAWVLAREKIRALPSQVEAIP